MSSQIRIRIPSLWRMGIDVLAFQKPEMLKAVAFPSGMLNYMDRECRFIELVRHLFSVDSSVRQMPPFEFSASRLAWVIQDLREKYIHAHKKSTAAMEIWNEISENSTVSLSNNILTLEWYLDASKAKDFANGCIDMGNRIGQSFTPCFSGSTLGKLKQVKVRDDLLKILEQENSKQALVYFLIQSIVENDTDIVNLILGRFETLKLNPLPKILEEMMNIVIYKYDVRLARVFVKNFLAHFALLHSPKLLSICTSFNREDISGQVLAQMPAGYFPESIRQEMLHDALEYTKYHDGPLSLVPLRAVLDGAHKPTQEQIIHELANFAWEKEARECLMDALVSPNISELIGKVLIINGLKIEILRSIFRRYPDKITIDVLNRYFGYHGFLTVVHEVKEIRNRLPVEKQKHLDNMFKGACTIQ